jgi:hypothetical protein
VKYDEPPSWMIPLRHTIGANLMAAGRFAEAEQVYRDDLKRLPENGWALLGLAQALTAQGKGRQRASVNTREIQENLGQSRCEHYELVSVSPRLGCEL